MMNEPSWLVGLGAKTRMVLDIEEAAAVRLVAVLKKQFG
jgi:hypothetical protein